MQGLKAYATFLLLSLVPIVTKFLACSLMLAVGKPGGYCSNCAIWAYRGLKHTLLVLGIYLYRTPWEWGSNERECMCVLGFEPLALCMLR